MILHRSSRSWASWRRLLHQRNLSRGLTCFSTFSNTGGTSSGLQDTADTVIIGGGIAGTSIAYHLARQGQKEVVLLEKTDLTAGSTWHAAGLTTAFQGVVNAKRLHYYSLNMYSHLAQETGQETGLHLCGSIRLATTPTRVDEMKYQISRSNHHEAPLCLLTPEQVLEHVPIANIDNILMGLYTPYDGHVDPYSLTQAIAKGARGYGAKILQGIGVKALRLREDGRWLVTTTQGDVLADRVVNAAGFWAKEVAKMAGSDLPLVPNHHQYIVTSTVPEVKALKKEIPVLRHLEGSFYLRMERDGLLVGPYESVETMRQCEDWVRDSVPKGFGKELFEPDLERLEPHLEVAMELVPCFANASIQSVVNGPITYTPDVLPLLGPDILPNMWLAAGFGYGIVHGGGIGKFLADWIQTGEPPFELNECDPLRFGSWATDDYVLAKARESYGMNNAITFPHEERFAGRPTCRVSGAHDLMEKRGACMHFHSGWEQPAWFCPSGKPEYQPSFRKTNWHSPVESEVELVMTSAGIIDLTPFAKLLVEGPDAEAFLNYITANKIPKVGRTVITHILTSTGHVYAELTVTRTKEDSFLVITGSGVEMHDLRWLQEQARHGGWKVSLANQTDDLGCLSVAGPKSKQILSKLSLAFEGKFPFFSAKEVNLAGIDLLAMRLSYTGELGWELYHPRSHSAKLYEALLDAGHEHGVGDFGTLALNVMRQEKGFKMWGAEMNMDTTIIDAGLMSFVNMKKGDFVGRAAVMELLKQRPKRMLVQLKVDSEDVDPHGDETVWLCGKVVGNTTSGCFSHHLRQPIAFAYLPPFLALPGCEVQIELLGNLCPATVLPGPPVLPHTARGKAAR
ncbi:dimethylglycine dehydrogenase, mitochondrial-like isoform X1 [Portunus trituberculatus]|uniref:dimethylglycine dehydrogenase, mitochondrial-like isoform X1 n=1 Tax=Portunus trituberculatus TaxID=210409 RepID=UPI001E1CEA48|nr:dimethylglycine dehydrogenase, mitochondrial-like isoform X1 [Portunus trituberculatus]